MPDAPLTAGPAFAWWLAFAVSAVLYFAFAAAVGARLVLGKLAAERVADERGLEPLDPGSRSWSAMLFARSLAISAAVLFAALGPLREHAFAAGAVAGILVALVGRVAEAVLAPRWPEEILNGTAPLVRLAGLVFGPFVAPLARNYVVQQARRRKEIADDDDEEALEEQLEEYIRDAEEGGILEEEAGELLREIVDASEVTAREVMTPRGEIVAISASATLDEAVDVFSNSRHSRLLVHDGGLDRVVGVLPVRDLLPHLRSPWQSVGVRGLMRPVPHVPATKRVLELLRELQEERQQIAVVVDEYGDTAGLVSLEDLVEEIVGEIRDEHENDEEQIREEDGTLVADGLVPVGDLEERIGREISEQDVETVGGLVFSKLARVPRPGDRVEVGDGVTLEVMRLRGRRVAQVRVLVAEAQPHPERPAEPS